MLKYLLLVLLSFTCYQSHSQIKLNKLDKSLRQFINQLDVSKDTVPDKYFMSIQQFEEMWKTANDDRPFDEEKVLKSYHRMKRATRKTFAKILKENNSSIVFSSYDTVTYLRDNNTLMKIFIPCERPFYLTMYRIENDAFLSSNIHRDDKYDYYRSVRTVKREEFENQFSKYALYMPTHTVLLQVLPYKNEKGLWGFKDLKTEKIYLMAQYDTIWAYSGGMWMLHREAGYNLLDTSYNMLIFYDQKHMRKRYDKNTWKYVYEYAEDGINYKICDPEVLNNPNKIQEENDEMVDYIEDINLDAHPSKPKTLGSRQSDLIAEFKKEEQQYQEKINIQTVSKDDGKTHTITAKDGKTLVVLNDYDDVTVIGNILLCKRSPIEWDVLTLSGDKLNTLNYLVEWNRSGSGIIALFDPITHRFGAYAIYSNTLIEPKYKYIYAAERGGFYMVMDDEDAYYLNAQGVAQK